MLQEAGNDELEQEVQQQGEGDYHARIQGKLDGQHERLARLEGAHHFQGTPPCSVGQDGVLGVQGFRQFPHGGSRAGFPDKNFLPVVRQGLRSPENQGGFRQFRQPGGNLPEQDPALVGVQPHGSGGRFLGLSPGVQIYSGGQVGFLEHVPYLVDGAAQNVHQIGGEPGTQKHADHQAEHHPQQHGAQIVQVLQKRLFFIIPLDLPFFPQPEYVL